MAPLWAWGLETFMATRHHGRGFHDQQLMHMGKDVLSSPVHQEHTKSGAGEDHIFINPSLILR